MSILLIFGVCQIASHLLWDLGIQHCNYWKRQFVATFGPI